MVAAVVAHHKDTLLGANDVLNLDREEGRGGEEREGGGGVGGAGRGGKTVKVDSESTPTHTPSDHGE